MGAVKDAVGGSALGQAVLGPVGSVAGAVGGAVGGLGSGLFGSGAGAPNVNFDPRNVSSLFGDVTFDEQGNATLSESDMLGGAIGGLFSGGQQLLGQGLETAGQDFSGLRDENLSLLRELAEPAEEQAAASTASRLFNQGVLGATGGANQMQALQEAQQTADLQRQLQSIGLAQQMQDRGLQQAQIGAGLFSQGNALGNPLFQQANLGTGVGAQEMSAQQAQGALQEQRRVGDRAFTGELIGGGLGAFGSFLGGL